MRFFTFTRFLAVLASVLVLGGSALGQENRARFAAVDGLWDVDTASRASDVKAEMFKGRRALLLRNNTHAIRHDKKFTNGVIEFDFLPTEKGDFFGLVFRRKSNNDFENLYFRLSRSGDFMALQYGPRVNGSSTWQLYPEYTAEAVWPRNEWTHVRLEVRASEIRVYIGTVIKPVLTVPRLRHGPGGEGDEIAFWARVSDEPSEWAAVVSNIEIKPFTAHYDAAPAVTVPPQFVAKWQVAEPTEQVTLPAPGAKWTEISAEERGLVNLNRAFRAQPGKRLTAYARTIISSDAALRIKAGIGYSDDVSVFLNGEPLYTGRNGWESRYPRFASFVDSRFENVWLPLEAGDNELVLAVTDDQLFGWGFAVELEEGAKVSVR